MCILCGGHARLSWGCMKKCISTTLMLRINISAEINIVNFFQVMVSLIFNIAIFWRWLIIVVFPVIAMESEHTLPVYGLGVPLQPELSVPNFRLGQLLTANARSSDPDGDPIQYQFRWCTQPGGGGTCVEGQTQIFNTPGNRYVVARAITPRGYPQETQGYSAWSQEVVANMIGTPPVAKDVQIIGNSIVGQVLTGHFTYEDIDGDPAGEHYYLWYRADDSAGALNKVLVAGGVDYVPTEDDIGKYLVLEVTPVSASGSIPNSGSSVSVVTVMPIVDSRQQQHMF